MELFLENNKKSIINNLKYICEKMKIDYIITLTKKGTLLFELLYDKKYLYISKEEKYIPIYADRIINKKDDYRFLNSNVLLFDDTMKTGRHFLHTKKLLLHKLKECSNDIDNNFYYYCILKCEGKTDFPKEELHNLFSYYQFPYDYESYYNFCLDEVNYFQKKLLGNSIDLPVFDLQIEDINVFKNVITNISDELIYNEHDCFIGNTKVSIGSIFLDKPDFIKLFDKFVVALTSKVRYEYDESINQYRILITPFALTGSIKYVDLCELFKRLFSEMTGNNLSETTMDLSYIKLYRYVNYFISYYTGVCITNILKKYGINFKYTDNGNVYYGCLVDNYIREAINDYNFNIYEKMVGFKYTSKVDLIKSTFQEYTFQELNEYLFNQIINREINSTEYSLITLNSMYNIFETTKNNLIRFCDVLICNIDSFLISNEIKLENSWIIRGFLPGEISVTALPYDARLFYSGLYSFYKKVNANYSDYNRDYDLFIHKFYDLLVSKNYFKTGFITSKSFDFFKQYFKNLDEENFEERIESKKYLLENEELSKDIEIISSIMDMLLTSGDFEINK
ncbi:hypothetical protein [Thomasclavelia cocleata]|uniref:hypothetical protein n=1 Tax=Thomasclavelia cocleata TaxID=69824 RepID=UPI00242C4A56|nr:hypothetical protein [Thomasclavelia cocleata]